ncbi:Mu transposase C-terminal domain-containing protein [Pedobacter jamesrossensis]|uniref:Mu transposase C-terminal domain-containing protein n=1 Tax=Pedobacter jamesrossensis TaxID=1908238 RepID=A0ABV8NMT4_9SPHI
MEKRSSLEKYRLIFPILERETTMVEVSKSEGIPVRTLAYWVKRFSEKGTLGLERTKRKDSGCSRVLSQELKELIQGMALQKPRLTISAIHRKIVLLAKRSSMKAPSYETVYSIVTKINPALLTLALEGSKVYQQKYELIYRRECNTPNEIWQCDHTELDIYIIDAAGREKKPWITTIIDDYSRAIMAIFISLDAPSALNTAFALRRAIWRKHEPAWVVCGIPQILYTDHGSDFMSDHIKQVCTSLKIRMINSAVGRPQGRGKIERFFGALNECLLIDLPGHSVKGKPLSKPKLTLEHLESAVMDFILNNYHVTSHSTTGIPPIDRWNNGFLPQMPESLEILDLLLLTIHKPRKVQRDGIRFQGMRYIAPTLAGFVGEQITIRYDPRDLAEIKVYHEEKFLCKGICQDLAEMVVSLKEIKAARSAVKNSLAGQIKDSKLLLKKLTQAKIIDDNKIKPKDSTYQENINSSKTSLKLYKNE